MSDTPRGSTHERAKNPNVRSGQNTPNGRRLGVGWTAWAAPFGRGAMAVLVKDLRIELATREIVTTTTFFAILVTVLASVSFASGVEGATRVGPGALWLSVVFASVLALGRTWQREREESALLGLLASPIPRASIWCGKALGLFFFMLAVEVLVVPTVALFFHVDLWGIGGPLAIVMLAGTLGVAAMGTLFGAMTVRTRARELLLASVLFPLLSPLLLSSVSATRELFYDAAQGQVADWGEVRDWLVLVGTFDGMAIMGALALFGMLIED